MRYVVAVAETGSFTRAAERCHVVQSALSHQVAKLERELGARLFDRTSRRVALTQAGEAFLPAARQCLSAAETAAAEVAAVSGVVRGRLAVGVIPTVAAIDVPAVLAGFRGRHPEVRVVLRTAPSDDLVVQVREGALDVALLGLPTSASPVGVRSRALARDHLVAVLAPDHPLAGAARTSLARLGGEVFVDFPTGTAGRAQSDLAFAAAGVERDVALEVGTVDLMTSLVRRGLGVAMLPAAYVPQLEGVATVPVDDAPRRVEHVVWSERGPSPAAAAFLRAIDVDPSRT
ncbi:DNA-binding transcriptional LysR family regulator [Isoptericola variabilis J7]|uniref:Transcriptional regulator, LysR family n=2 Tax=Isoptericola TaxID=254250 RepID=F6FQC3_ISOV2|nr:transcriptional regulator, LysR family [Isoptericola variabilis 225]TWH34098.1 DNA-binding transcriptional LysR family regulator [Isoptericola variabilis J7]